MHLGGHVGRRDDKFKDISTRGVKDGVKMARQFQELESSRNALQISATFGNE